MLGTHRDLGWNRGFILQSFGALRMFLKLSKPQMSETRVPTPRAVRTKENGLWTTALIRPRLASLSSQRNSAPGCRRWLVDPLRGDVEGIGLLGDRRHPRASLTSERGHTSISPTSVSYRQLPRVTRAETNVWKRGKELGKGGRRGPG